MRIISLLPAATEIAGALGLMEQVVGVSHECDFPEDANERPRVIHCPIHSAGLTSGEVDAWVRHALRENGTIYTIDEPLLRELRPDVILTQKLCDVCAVGYDTVAKLAETLPDRPQVVNLEPSSLNDIFDDIRRVAETCEIPERAEKLIVNLSGRVENVRKRASRISQRRRCFLMEWVDPPFCSGHWGPELVEIAVGHDSLGRKHQPSAEVDWQHVLDAHPEDHSARTLRLRYQPRPARLRIAEAVSWIRFNARCAQRRNLPRKCQRLLLAPGSPDCGQS